MSGQGCSLGSDALHEVPVTDDAIDIVVNDGMVARVVSLSGHLGSDGHAHAVGEALSQRTSGGVHTRSQTIFGVTWRLAAPLSKALDLVQGEVVSRQVQQGIEQHGTVASR